MGCSRTKYHVPIQEARELNRNAAGLGERFPSPRGRVGGQVFENHVFREVNGVVFPLCLRIGPEAPGMIRDAKSARTVRLRRIRTGLLRARTIRREQCGKAGGQNSGFEKMAAVHIQTHSVFRGALGRFRVYWRRAGGWFGVSL